MTVMSLIVSTTSLANDGIKVTINGKSIEFDVQLHLINNRTMVPLCPSFETLGAEVEIEW